MNTRSAKRRVEEIAKASSVKENELLWKLSSEMWKMIFNKFENSYTEGATRNKALAGLRQVCKYWCDLVDEHMDFVVELSETFVSKNWNMEHVRVKKLIVTRLYIDTIKVSQIPVFSNPALVKEFVFGEFVSKKNFLVLADHFGKFGEVKRVSILQGFWFDYALTPTPQQQSIFGRFWEKVEKLDLNIPCLDLMMKEWTRERNLIEILKTGNLPMLKDLKISAHWRLATTRLIPSFLRRHPSVKNLHLTLAPINDYFAPSFFLNEGEINKELYCDPNGPLSFDELRNIQLENISIEGATMSHVVRHTWAAVILAQRNLAKLKLSNVGHVMRNEPLVAKPLKFTDLVPMIHMNVITLTDLELGTLEFEEHLDFKMFQKLTQLKTLKLEKNDGGLASKIVNLTSLPASLEVFSINGFACSNVQLKRFAKASNLKKLQKMELFSVRNFNQNQPRAIPEEVILALLKKKSLVDLNLDEMTVSRVFMPTRIYTVNGENIKVDGIMKYFVLDERYFAPVLQNWNSDNLGVSSYTIKGINIK